MPTNMAPSIALKEALLIVASRPLHQRRALGDSARCFSCRKRAWGWANSCAVMLFRDLAVYSCRAIN